MTDYDAVMDERRKRSVALALLAMLLIPTAYAMLTQRFGIAAICVAGIVIVRALGIKPSPPDADE